MHQLLRWQAIIDLLALTAAIYLALSWARRARALRIVLLLLALHAGSLLARHFEVIITSWVLEGAAVIALVVLVLAFQAEVRYAVMRMESGLWPGRRPSPSQASALMADTAFALAASRIGSIMVAVRKDSITELLNGGVLLGANISSELIQSIFQKDSPLHDGAVIIEGLIIARAGVYLPLTNRRDLPFYFGTRHRAAIGLAERCDAAVVVTSEERGEVMLMEGRSLQHLTTSAKLAQALEGSPRRVEQGLENRVRRLFFSNLRYKLASFGLAATIWAMSFLLVGTAVRTLTMPVEFSNVPDGLEIATYSTDHLDVQLRGNTWIMDSISDSRPVVRLDLAGAKPGTELIRVRSGDISLPPGVTVASIAPRSIAVSLARKPG
ncbi:MAG TPA: diadenylate cyclase [Bryobacteraceae bacterium]|nr:diadenylate cyclase [Bryobacteraceae bacterium]